MAVRSRWASLSSAVEVVLRALFMARRRERALPPARCVEPLEGRQLLSVSVNLGATNSIDEGDTLTLNLSALENGSTTLAVTSWTIDWGDALAAPENTTNTNPTHTYQDGDEDYDIVVTAHISDPYNNIYGDYQGTYEVHVENVDAFVFAYGDSSATEDSDYTVQAYYDDVGDDHVISWTIDWGDGTSDNVPADGSSLSYTHRFDQSGVQRTITVTANDEDGSYSAAYPVTVTNVDPSVSTSAGGYGSFREGTDTVYLNGSYSHPGDGVTGWIINWGNGSMSGGPGNPITGNTLAMGLIYPDDGMYTISVSVTDDDGRQFGFEHQVSVDNVAPEIELDGDDDDGLVNGDTFTLTASIEDPGDDTVTGWEIDWGDGITTTPTGNTGSFQHVYATGGNYTVSATAIDEDGEYLTTYTLEVQNADFDAKIEVDQGDIDVIGDMVPSNVQGGERHFVSPKQASAFVTLVALVPPNVNFAGSYQWEFPAGKAELVQGAPNKLKVKRDSADKIVVKLLKKKQNNAEADRMNVWIVWTELTGGPPTRHTFQANATPAGDGAMYSQNVFVGVHIQFDMKTTATIQPAAIITDADRPDLSGANTPGSVPGGAALQDGVDTKWDMSRRITVRGGVSGTSPPPAPTPADAHKDYPVDPLVGNDDDSVHEDDGNPYDNVDYGKLTQQDRVIRQGPGTVTMQWGHVGDFYTSQLWLQDFARVEIGGKWYLISSALPWRVEFHFRKYAITEGMWGMNADGKNGVEANVIIKEAHYNPATDYNGDGDTNDDLGYWGQDLDFNSFAQPDNAGLPQPGQ